VDVLVQPVVDVAAVDVVVKMQPYAALGALLAEDRPDHFRQTSQERTVHGRGNTRQVLQPFVLGQLPNHLPHLMDDRFHVNRVEDLGGRLAHGAHRSVPYPNQLLDILKVRRLLQSPHALEDRIEQVRQKQRDPVIHTELPIAMNGQIAQGLQDVFEVPKILQALNIFRPQTPLGFPFHKSIETGALPWREFFPAGFSLFFPFSHSPLPLPTDQQHQNPEHY